MLEQDLLLLAQQDGHEELQVLLNAGKTANIQLILEALNGFRLQASISVIPIKAREETLAETDSSMAHRLHLDKQTLDVIFLESVFKGLASLQFLLNGSVGAPRLFKLPFDQSLRIDGALVHRSAIVAHQIGWEDYDCAVKATDITN